MIVALHRVYLEPDGPIFNALMQPISNSISLDAALNKSAKDYPQAIQIIGNALTNIVSKLTEFMVERERRFLSHIRGCSLAERWSYWHRQTIRSSGFDSKWKYLSRELFLAMRTSENILK